MKKGYVINNHPSLIPANHDLIYIEAMLGTTLDPKFTTHWESINSFKRGLIHQPALTISANEYDNASKFLELLENLGRNNWDNGNPLIIDIWEALGDTKFNFDHIRVYGQYITDNFRPSVKPLLRINIATWNAYLNNNYTEAIRLLRNWDLLLLQPGVLKPAELTDYGLPMYWEYDFGLFKVDETRQWIVSEPVPMPEPEPLPEPEPTQPAGNIPKKWKIKLLGGLISGTIEAEE